jgi:hypothetical protein
MTTRRQSSISRRDAVGSGTGEVGGAGRSRLGPGEQIRCFIASGLPKEVEDQINAFLAERSVRVVHMTQSEGMDNLKVTILYAPAEGARGGGPASLRPEPLVES